MVNIEYKKTYTRLTLKVIHFRLKAKTRPRIFNKNGQIRVYTPSFNNAKALTAQFATIAQNELQKDQKALYVEKVFLCSSIRFKTHIPGDRDNYEKQIKDCLQAAHIVANDKLILAGYSDMIDYYRDDSITIAMDTIKKRNVDDMFVYWENIIDGQ